MGRSYVGSVTGKCLSNLGNKIGCVDVYVEKGVNYLFSVRPLLEIELNGVGV